MRRPLRALAVAGAVALVAACSIHNRVEDVMRRLPASPPRSVCVLFFDGLSSDALGKLVASGALPNLKHELLDRGLSYETAVASIPSETYPNLAAMLTGLFPGHHGIPANVWLDRRIYRREAHTNIFKTFSVSDFLSADARTLYERLPADTVAITTPIARGATIHSRNVLAVMASYLRNDWGFLDRKSLDDAGDAYAGAAATGKLPSLVWTHLLGPDEVAHAEGPDSAAFRHTLQTIDRAFARLVRRLKRRHAYDRTLFVMLGDHGNAPYTHVESAELLVHRALFDHPAAADCAGGDCRLLAKVKKGQVDVGNAVISVGAYRGVMIWLPAIRPPENVPTVFRNRKGLGRKRRLPSALLRMPPPSDFAATLARFQEVRLVVTRASEPGQVSVYGPAGRGEIVRRDFDDRPSVYAYRVVDGSDPLGYQSDPGVAPMLGKFFSADDWLEKTAPTEYPDLVVQMAEYFDAPRAPDVFVSPADGWGFKFGKVDGHGGLSRKEMVVPLVFAGPGVPHAVRPFARTVDLAPTLLSYLGIDYDPDDMDGDDLDIGSVDAALSAPLPGNPSGDEPD